LFYTFGAFAATAISVDGSASLRPLAVFRSKKHENPIKTKSTAVVGCSAFLILRNLALELSMVSGDEVDMITQRPLTCEYESSSFLEK
jgi:hypothetical protein